MINLFEKNIYNNYPMNKVIYLLLIIVVIIFKPEFKSEINSSLLIFYNSIMISAMLIYFNSIKKNNNWFRIDLIFLIGFIIVHFQWAIMYSFSDLLPENIYRFFVDPIYFNFATYLSLLGLLGWFFGFELIKEKPPKKQHIYIYSTNNLRIITTISFIIYFIENGSYYLAGGKYTKTITQEASAIGAYMYLIFSISILILTAILILNNRSKWNGNLFRWIKGLDKRDLIIIISYALFFVLSGDRGPVLKLAIVVLFFFSTFVRSIGKMKLLMLITSGALLLTIIGNGRGKVDGQNIVFSGVDNFQLNNAYDITLELANSSRTLYKGLSHVPEKHDYFYGKLWSGNILSVIPFAQSAYIYVTGAKKYETGSARYITFLTFGPNSVSGEGTSLIIDIYLNFGVFGVFAFMTLFGYFFKIIINKLNTDFTKKWLLILIVITSLSFYFGRSDLFVFFRPVVFGIIIITFLVKRKKMTLKV